MISFNDMPTFLSCAFQQSFTISPTDLKSKYKSLMMELHPDRHVDNTEKETKLQEATHVTRAHDVLINPLSRALHLLELNGSSIEEGDAVSLLYFSLRNSSCCVLKCICSMNSLLQ